MSYSLANFALLNETLIPNEGLMDDKIDSVLIVLLLIIDLVLWFVLA